MGNYEISRRFDIPQPLLSIVALQLVVKYQRKGNLVHLQATANRATVDPGVLRETPIRFLLYLEKIVKRAIGAGSITHGEKSRAHVIKIARPNSVVAANGGLIRVWTTTPGNGWRSNHCAAMSFVFQGLQRQSSHTELKQVLRLEFHGP